MAGERPLRHLVILAASLAAGCSLVFAGVRPGGHAAAAEVLQNGGFEAWTGPSPAGWSVSGAAASQETSDTVSGKAVRLNVTGTALLTQTVLGVGAGSTLHGSVEFSGPATSLATLRVISLDAGYLSLGTAAGSPANGTGSFRTLTFDGQVTLPATAHIQFQVQVTGPGVVIFDNAALDLELAVPTAIPTQTPTPTATTTTPPGTPTAAPPGSTGTATPENSPTATKTPAVARTPTIAGESTPTREPTATKTPTASGPKGSPTKPLPTSTPTLAPGSNSGGMLKNGDFEVVSDGKPAWWEKYGGDMVASGEAAAGSYAGCLESDTSSVKWMHQVVPVEPGRWYAAVAQGRVQGPGAVSIRVSWYEAADGSGSQLQQDEGNSSGSSGWASLAAGPLQAPEGAAAARVRLVLRPAGAVTGCFDDANFSRTVAPAPTPVPTTPATGGATATRTAPSTPASDPGGGVAARPGATLPAASAALAPGLSATLRISEVMADPAQSGRDAAYEWVELVNIGSEPVDLTGWKLADGTSATELPSLVVPPGGYAVVAGASAELPASALVARPSSGQIGNGLGNTGDLLRLLSPSGEVTDEMSYGDNVKVFDPAPPAPDTAATLAVRDPNGEPASENWAISLRPTPGEANVFPQRAPGTRETTTPEPVAPGSLAGRPLVAVDEANGGGSVAPWLVLAGIAGVSVGIAGAAFGPRIRTLLERLRRAS